MTPDEMREQGKSASGLEVERGSLWKMLAELCERLEALAPSPEKELIFRNAATICTFWKGDGIHRWGVSHDGQPIPLDRCWCDAKRPEQEAPR